MPKTYQINEEQAKEIENAMKKCTDTKVFKRLKALDMRAKGKKGKAIAEATGFNRKYISILLTKYLKDGIESIVQDMRKSNYRKMTAIQEREFLKPFIEAAQNGQIITVTEMRVAYDVAIGKESSVPTIYNVLHRNGWRKIMPRSKHPKKASDEAIEASKKLTLNFTD